MRIHLSPDADAMGAAAAKHAERVLTETIAARGHARVIAATGNSQLAFLRHLVESTRVDWSRVELFHLDEYVGLAADHPASFRRVLREHLVDRTGIPTFHALDGDGDVDAVRRTVGAAIARAPIDVAFVGIGENTHLAFNDPPADFETTEPYLVVALDEACRRQQVGEGWFPTLDDVPTPAPSRCRSARSWRRARSWRWSRTQRKAAAVAAVLTGPITPDVPASILRTHDRTTLYLDAASASLADPAVRGRRPGLTRRPIAPQTRRSTPSPLAVGVAHQHQHRDDGEQRHQAGHDHDRREGVVVGDDAGGEASPPSCTAPRRCRSGR